METLRANGAPLPMHSTKPITAVVTRFDDLLARGLHQVINGDPSVEILADDVAQNRLGVVLRAQRPGVAILDGDQLPSLAEIRRLSDEHPGVRLVLLVSHPETAESAQALAFGASAFLGKDTQSRDVLTAIHLASRGLQLIPRVAHADPHAHHQHSQATTHRLNGHQPAAIQPLTQREAEVLPLLQQGRSNQQIAAALHVGVETVRTHASNIYRKLGVASRRELNGPASPSAVERLSSPPQTARQTHEIGRG